MTRATENSSISFSIASKTGTWASHAADPMYYMLYVANGWIDPIDDYLGDAKLTDDSWFMFEDIQPGHRGGASVGGRPYPPNVVFDATWSNYVDALFGDFLDHRRSAHEAPSCRPPRRC